jgi:hypothetical protein
MIFRRVFRRILGGGNEWSGVKGKKDFHVHIAPDGTIHAVCATCGSTLDVREDEWTIWFSCETCQRQSYYGADDVARDRRRAAEAGETITIGHYYYDRLPAGAKPPPRGWD